MMPLGPQRHRNYVNGKDDNLVTCDVHLVMNGEFLLCNAQNLGKSI